MPEPRPVSGATRSAPTDRAGTGRTPSERVRAADRSLDRGTGDGAAASLPIAGQVPRAAPTAPPAFRVDEAIATLEQARRLVEAPVPRFILAREWVGHVQRWLSVLTTPDRLNAAFQVELARDPLLSRPVAVPLALAALQDTGYLHRRLQDPLVRPLGTGTWDVAIRSVRAARVPLLVLNGEFVSFELAEAAKLPSVVTTLPNLTPPEQQVLAWLQKYRAVFESTEARFPVDRRSMAGAIAWEALFNPRSSSPRSAGPGKIHLYEFTKTSVAVEVEQRNLLPARSYAERRQILATAEGAILYVGAIMHGFAQIATAAGYAIDCNAALLANCYNAFNLTYWERHLARKEAARDPAAPRAPLELGNAMGFWVHDHLAYLDDGVGVSDRCRVAPR